MAGNGKKKRSRGWELARTLRGGRLTKLAGAVASCAPRLRGAAALLTSVSAIAAGIAATLGLTASEALAACVRGTAATGPVTFTCTGTIASTEGLDGGSRAISVSLDATASATVVSGPAFRLNSNAGIQFVQAPGGESISAADSGIRAFAGGTGTLGIETTGPIFASGSGTTAAAIYARHRGSGEINITVSGTLTGDGGGIRASGSSATIVANAAVIARGAGTSGAGGHDGIGVTVDSAVSITARSRVSSVHGDGIDAQIGASRGSSTIAAATVSGGDSGIRAVDSGNGDLAVSATGSVTAAGTGAENAGIFVRKTRDGSGGVSVSAAQVAGGSHGIKALALADGALSIRATGSVTARADHAESAGVYAVKTGSGDMTVDVAGASGAAHGIRAVGNGPGDVTVRATGTVRAEGTAATHAAILVSNGEGGDTVIRTGDVLGGRHGVSVVDSGDGTIRVEATGRVSANATAAGSIGILIINTGNGDITVTAADVGGAAHGIRVTDGGSGSLSVTATGTVDSSGTGANDAAVHVAKGTAGGDLSLRLAGATGAMHGVRAFNRGSGRLSVTASSRIEALGSAEASIGVAAESSGNGGVAVSVAGVAAGLHGVRAEGAGGNMTVTATQHVSATGSAARSEGVVAQNSGSGNVTVRVARVTGGLHGIRAAGAGGIMSVTATQHVSATGSAAQSAGVVAENSGTGNVTVSVARVTGGLHGVRAAAAGGALSVTASERVLAEGTAAGSAGISAANTNGGRVAIRVADVTGGLHGIRATAEGGRISVTATGRIAADASATGSVGVGVEHSGSGTVSINVGDASGSRHAIEAVDRGPDDLSVTTSGAISASGSGAGAAIRVSKGTAGGNVTVSAAGISGGSRGIDVADGGSGIVRVEATGAVVSTAGTGAGDAGIRVVKGTAGGNVDVRVKDVNAAMHGIWVVNEGSGTIWASSDSAVAANSFAAGAIGVYAKNAEAGATRLRLNDVTGTKHGIMAIDEGSGDLSVRVSGSVAAFGVGGGDSAIYAKSVSSGGMEVATDGAVRGRSGIRAIENGSGTLQITAKDAVTATIAGIGIHASHGSMGGNLTITATQIAGGTHGILAETAGDGDIMVRVTEEVSANRDASGAVGIRLESRGDGEIILNAASVTGRAHGIQALSDGDGSISINATGSVAATGLGADSDAIRILRTAGSGNVDLRATTVSGGAHGVRIVNAGAGDISASLSGQVISGGAPGGSTGVYLKSGLRGRITLNAASVTGERHGIAAFGLGSGTWEIAATGAVMATGTGSKDAAVRIEKTDAAGSGAVSVRVADVSGGKHGILAVNNGLGDLTINVSGSVTASGADSTAVHATDGGDGNLSIRVGSATGASHGIAAFGSGTGFLSVTATGHVEARSASGRSVAILANSTGTGGLTIAAASVTGTQGVVATDSGSGSLRVTLSGSATASGTGADQAGVSTTNAGGGGTTVIVDDVTGAMFGLRVADEGDGQLNVTARGSLTSARDGSGGAGLHVTNSGGRSTISVASVTGGASGAWVRHAGGDEMSVVATGAIAATGTSADTAGLIATNSGSGTMNVRIVDARGRAHGVRAVNDGTGAFNLTATGLLASAPDGSGGAGIDLVSAGRATLAVASVTGGSHGIRISDSGSGALSVAATGMVHANGSSADATGIDIRAVDGGNISVSTDRVAGTRHGIRVDDAGDGRVAVTATGSVTSAATGGAAIHVANAEGGTTLNVASVTGSSGIRISDAGSGTLTVAATGAVAATGSATGAWGIRIDKLKGGNVTLRTQRVAGGVRALTTGSATISVNAAGSVTVGAHNTAGIHAGGRMSNSVRVTSASVTGGSHGIHAYGDGIGEVVVDARGSVTGAVGILASGGDGSSVSVRATHVKGADYGIQALNSGSGTTDLTATGEVSASGTAAIDTRVSENGGDITIRVGRVVGGQHGMRISNAGSGTLSVAVTDMVTAVGTTPGAAGIRIESAGGDMNLNAGSVTAAGHGIWAFDGAGVGALQVNATGAVETTGSTTFGIRAENRGGGNLSVNTASVTGAAGGIWARDEGSGSLSVNATGMITATVSAAGLHAENLGGGDTRINVGSVTGMELGMDISSEGGGALSVTASGDVRAVGAGAVSGLRVANRGSGNATIRLATVSGVERGIDASADGSGTLSVTASQIVTASGTGAGDAAIHVSRTGNGSTRVNVASATGGAYGIWIRDRGTAATTIEATGRVEATGTASGTVAIRALKEAAGGNLSVSANDAAGVQHGIWARNEGSGTLSVTAQSLVTATGTGADAAGIRAWNAGSGNVTLSAASVTSSGYGIWAHDAGSGTLSVSASGSVTAATGVAAASGIRAVKMSDAGNLAVTAATVSGGLRGIHAIVEGSGTLAVTATGSVTATGGGPDGAAIRAMASAAGGVTVRAADVFGASHGIWASSDSSGTLSVTATGSVVSSGTFAGASGIRAENAGSGNVSVSVASVTSQSYGIRAFGAGGTLTVSATGLIVSGTGNADSSGIRAVNTEGDVAVTASSSVTGALRGIWASSNRRGSGVSVTATGPVAAEGTGAGSIGIYAAVGRDADISISAAGASGAESGIVAKAEGDGTVEISVSGSVTSSIGAAISAETHRLGRTVVTLRDGARIRSESGPAISNDDGDSEVTAEAGSVIVGSVTLGDGKDRLTFEGNSFSEATLLDGGDNATGTLDVLRFGDSASGTLSATTRNWESIEFARGSRVGFDGNRTVSADVISLVGGELTMADGAADDTLTISGNLNGGGAIAIDVDVTDGKADRLAVVGDATIGAATTLRLVGVRLTAQVSDKRIPVASVRGKVNESSFNLESDKIQVGPMEYQLEFESQIDAQSGEFAVTLSESRPNSIAAAVEAAPAVLMSRFARAEGLAQRTVGRTPLVGSGRSLGQSLLYYGPREAFGLDGDAWFRIHGDANNYGAGPSGNAFKDNSFGVTAGLDILSSEGETGDFVLGLFGRYGTATATATAANGMQGSVQASGPGIGLAATWFGDSGTYVDFQAHSSSLSLTYSADFRGTLADGVSATSTLASIEFGKRFSLEGGAAIVPQAQFARSEVDTDNFSQDGVSATTEAQSGSSARLGVTYEFGDEFGKGRLLANLLIEDGGQRETVVNDVKFAADTESTIAEIGYAATYAMGEGMSLFGQAIYRTAVGDSSGYDSGASLSGGVRLTW